MFRPWLLLFLGLLYFIPAQASSPQDAEQEVTDTLRQWAAAWSGRQTESYLGHYSTSFQPQHGKTRESWEKSRRKALSRNERIFLQLDNVRIKIIDTRHVSLIFKQIYRSPSYHDATLKRLDWEKNGDRWYIIREETLSSR